MPLAGCVEGLPGQCEQGMPSGRLVGSAVEQDQNDAAFCGSGPPIAQRLLKSRHRGAVSAQEDAGPRCRLTLSAANDDPRGADLDHTELGGGDILVIEMGYIGLSTQASILSYEPKVPPK